LLMPPPLAPLGPRPPRGFRPALPFPAVGLLPLEDPAPPAASRLYLGAKNSSDAASARPPTRAAARSTRPSFNEATFQFLASETPLAHTRTFPARNSGARLL